MGSEQPSWKRPRFESDPKDGNEGNLPSAMETSWKGKEKVTESSHCPDVDTDVDIPAEERRTLKIGMTANRLEMDPPLSTPTRQTSGRDNNHIPAGVTTKEVHPTSRKLPFDGIMEESVCQMTPMLSNILEHHGRANQRLASLEEDLAHAKLEEEKLKATIEALEKEKSEMNAKVALMERKDLYDLLEAKMEGFQIANHPRTIGGFENLNLTITKKWVEIPRLNNRGITGHALPVIDETELTLWRTACISLVAAIYLVRVDAWVLAIVEAGALAPHLIEAYVAINLSIETIS
ncbi:hypothetical protein R1flu_021555 [Riccia fluitans]|uniref:Uncharacterized protein n=1 Tax=Riccia fluitans TaxID=41844 RepID=A0ABD1ZQ94_9MARC